MLLFWNVPLTAPKRVNLPSGKLLHVDPADGLILGDIGEADADRMLTNCKEIRIYRGNDGPARLAGFRAGSAKTHAGGVISGLRQAFATKEGRAQLKEILTGLFSDEEPEAAPEAVEDDVETSALPEDPRLPHELLDGNDDGLVIAPAKAKPIVPVAKPIDPVEMQIKIAEGHRLMESHNKTELKGLCRDKQIEFDPLDRKSDLIRHILPGLQLDWDKTEE